MDQFFKAVSEAGLNTEIVQKVKENIEDRDDLQLLIIGDIGEMFPDIKLKERKTLWKVISQHQKLSAEQKTSHHSGTGSVSQKGDKSVLLGTGSIGSNAQVAGTINNAPRDSSNLNITVRDVTGSSVAGGNVTNTGFTPRRKNEMQPSKRRAEETETDNDHKKRIKTNNDPRQKAKQTNAGDSGKVNISAGYVSGSSIAGGDVINTTHNTRQEKSKYRISMNNAKGVAVGDHSLVQDNHFNH